ncbi:hypothetical protein ACWD69_22470 [Micromonospora chokoriensis]
MEDQPSRGSDQPQYAELYTKAAEAAKHLFDVVSGLITKLIDVLIVVNLASAVGTATIETGIGPVVGYGVAAYYAWQAYDLYLIGRTGATRFVPALMRTATSSPGSSATLPRGCICVRSLT